MKYQSTTIGLINFVLPFCSNLMYLPWQINEISWCFPLKKRRTGWRGTFLLFVNYFWSELQNREWWNVIDCSKYDRQRFCLCVNVFGIKILLVWGHACSNPFSDLTFYINWYVIYDFFRGASFLLWLSTLSQLFKFNIVSNLSY